MMLLNNGHGLITWYFSISSLLCDFQLQFFLCFLVITLNRSLQCKKEGTIAKIFSRSIRRRNLVLISSLLRKWRQIEILKIWLPASVLFCFLTITFEPLITVQNGVTSERASQDLSDAEHLVLISSLLRKWWQIEILKIWLWLQIFVGFWPITLEPLITVQKWKIPSERASQDLSDADNLVLISSLLTKWRLIEILTIWC